MPYQTSNPPIADISVLSVQGSYRRIWHNACFLFILNGEVQVEVDGHACYLNNNGIMLVEADTPYTVTGHGSNLLMTIRMDYDFFPGQGRPGHGDAGVQLGGGRRAGLLHAPADALTPGAELL